MKYDLVIKNGTLVDGISDERYIANIGILKDKISIISKSEINGKRVINANGKIVAPGFIDLHTHSETGFILDHKMEAKIYQGVTTDITGNCGASLFPAPLEDYKVKEFETYSSELLMGMDKMPKRFKNYKDYTNYIKENKIGINFIGLIGHGTIRIYAMGFDDREATDEELEIMKSYLDNELSNGAMGMSVGLIYPPGSYANKKELVELAKVIKKHNKIFAFHMRNEGEKVFEAVREVIDISRETGVKAHISHLKLMGPNQWGKAKKLVKLIDDAKKEGINISVDQYPYTATSTTLTAVIPGWVQDGGAQKMLERLKRADTSILNEIGEIIRLRGGADSIKIAYTNGYMPKYEGKSLKDLALEYNLSVEKMAIKILVDCESKVNAVYYSMSEEDVEYILSQEDIAVGSDGFALSYSDKGNGKPHPRSFGTFPRFLRINREKNLLSLEKAIKKITSIPAKILGLDAIGTLKEGNYADIVIFDEDSIGDCSTFKEPFKKPKGIKKLIISGEIVLKDGKLTENKAGRIIGK